MAAAALIVGCAGCVWDDVRAAQALCDFDAVYCVKMAGIYWPHRFDVWVTLHPEYMNGENDKTPKENYVAQRKALGLPDGYEIVMPLDGEVGRHAGKCKQARRVSYRWPGMNASASSGIFGAKVALDDGFDRVVLAGIPMTKEAGHFLPHTTNGDGQTRGRIWDRVDSFTPGFEIAKKFMAGKVRSMSGHTAKVLGTPDRAWLEGKTP